MDNISTLSVTTLDDIKKYHDYLISNDTHIQNYINEYLNYGFDYTGDDNMSADDKIETYWDEAEGVEK